MAGSNSFLHFNPGAANQETDEQWSADGQRTGGIAVNAIVPSVMLNKALYQLSAMVAALGQAMANKGYAMSDASLVALITNLSDILVAADLPSYFQKSLATNGYQQLPGGMIVQWGQAEEVSIGVPAYKEGNIDFPIPFPNAALSVNMSAIYVSGSTIMIQPKTWTLSAVTYRAAYPGFAVQTSRAIPTFLAIGH